MLRAFVVAVGVVLAAVGAWLRLVRGMSVPGIQFLVMGVLLVVAVILERWRYRRTDSRTGVGPPWQRTGERFVDPESGKNMEVIYDPATGERRYVESAD